jgi:hypothetical protein
MIYSLLVILLGVFMQSINHICRACQAERTHQIRIVSDLLPAYVHVLECTGCGYLCITSVDNSGRV